MYAIRSYYVVLSSLFADLVDPVGALSTLLDHLEQETDDLVFFCLNQSGKYVASSKFPLSSQEAMAAIRITSYNVCYTKLLRLNGYLCFQGGKGKTR